MDTVTARHGNADIRCRVRGWRWFYDKRVPFLSSQNSPALGGGVVLPVSGQNQITQQRGQVSACGLVGGFLLGSGEVRQQTGFTTQMRYQGLVTLPVEGHEDRRHS